MRFQRNRATCIRAKNWEVRGQLAPKGQKIQKISQNVGSIIHADNGNSV